VRVLLIAFSFAIRRGDYRLCLLTPFCQEKSGQLHPRRDRSVWVDAAGSAAIRRREAGKLGTETAGS
jgi:hypothetical protein